MNLEERILNIAEGPNWYDSRELRAIALDVRKMEERIKRLVEAGDRMELYAAPHDSDKWNEAKEDKP